MILEVQNRLSELHKNLTLPDSKRDESWRKFSFKNFNPLDYSLVHSDFPTVEHMEEIGIISISSMDMESKGNLFQRIENLLISHSLNYFQSVGLRDIENGLLVEIPGNVTNSNPIIISRSIPNGSNLFSPFTYIQVGGNSDCVVVDELNTNYNSKNTFQWLNPLTIIEIGESSRLEYIDIDRIGSSVFYFNNLFSFQSRDSYFKNFHFYTGGYRSKVQQNLVLEGEGAELRSIGLSANGGREFWDHEAEIKHKCSYSTSSLLHKVVVKDNAHHIFTGNLHIPPGLFRVSASQVNHNLSLNPNARIESIPKLEIFSEDVQSSHGSTVGEVSDEQLYYLKSRGIDEEEAKQLLIEAFVTELIDEVKSESIQDMVKSAIKEIIWPS